MNSNSAKGRRVRVSMAAWSVLALVVGPASAAVAESRPNAAESAVASREIRLDPMSEYVRVLIYWHHHPDWGLGG